MRKCPTGKKIYETKLLAEIKLIRYAHIGTGICRAYKCRICGSWHLTSQAYKDHTAPTPAPKPVNAAPISMQGKVIKTISVLAPDKKDWLCYCSVCDSKSTISGQKLRTLERGDNSPSNVCPVCRAEKLNAKAERQKWLGATSGVENAGQEES